MQNIKKQAFRLAFLAGLGGVEPPRRESKSRVLPLDYSPVSMFFININLQRIFLADLQSGVESRIRTDGLQCHKLAL